MQSIVLLTIFLVVYILMQVYILPKLGIYT